MTSHHIEAEVLVNGKRVAHHKHDGRHFIEGREGTEYSLRIKNDNGYRVKVSVGVDGVNVVDGRPLGINPEEAGYLINAHDSLTIKGYRVDNENVAAFRFSKADQAYASKDKKLTGTTGVITVRAYAEKERPAPPPAPTIIHTNHHHYHGRRYGWPHYEDYGWPFRDYTWCSTTSRGIGSGSVANAGMGVLRSCALNAKSAQSSLNSIQCSAGASADSSAQFSTSLDSTPDENPFSLGSSWGQKTESKVREVAFEVGAFLTQLDLYYTTREGLKTLGVDLSPKASVVFPDATPSRYCQAPAGWVE